MRKFALFVCVFFFAVLAFADEPPTWAEWTAQSKNGKFTAEISRNHAAEEPWDDGWTLTIKDADKKEVWRTKFLDAAYFGGALSDDGKTFVYVEFWYYPDSCVVRIYKSNGETKTITGKEIVTDDKILENTVSHQIWLEKVNGFSNDGKFYSITLLGGQEVKIPLD